MHHMGFIMALTTLSSHWCRLLAWRTTRRTPRFALYGGTRRAAIRYVRPAAASRSADSGVKRNILGRCGNALAENGNSGWRDVGRDASEAGREGAAGRA